MTAQIFDMKGQPFQPAAAPSQAVARVPGQSKLVNRFSPEEIVAIRLIARSRLSNAIDVYRDAFGSNRLAAVLINAAEDERRLIEDCR